MERITHYNSIDETASPDFETFDRNMPRRESVDIDVETDRIAEDYLKTLNR